MENVTPLFIDKRQPTNLGCRTRCSPIFGEVRVCTDTCTLIFDLRTSSGASSINRIRAITAAALDTKFLQRTTKACLTLRIVLARTTKFHAFVGCALYGYDDKNRLHEIIAYIKWLKILLKNKKKHSST